MNTGIVKSKASGLALMGKVLVGVMVVGAGVMPMGARAVASDAQFLQYIDYVCNNPNPSWEPVAYFNMCSNYSNDFVNGPAGPGALASVSTNLSTTRAGEGALKKKGRGDFFDEAKEKPAKGASADGGGLGFLVTPQYSKSNRPDTDLENGYQSELSGLVLGVDYRASDNSFVLGVMFGRTQDRADFLNGAGYLKSNSNTATMYWTWLLSDTAAVDGYIGYGKLSFNNQRRFDFGASVSGIMSGQTVGRQVLAGLSTNFRKNLGSSYLSPFISIDYIKTNIDGYAESGSNTNTSLLALRYGDRSTLSVTSSLGAKVDKSYYFDWGELLPTVGISAVHEFQKKSRQLSNELVITPGTSFRVETDSPDRNYLNFGMGITAALNSGTLLFLDYEKRTQDKLLSSWAVSLGGLFEF